MSRIDELRNELKDLERAEQIDEQRQKQAKEKAFKEDTELNFYWASDYAGSSNGKYSFYYGYEHEFCPKHGFTDHTSHQNCENEEAEWAFVAYKGDDVVAEYKTSELWFEYLDTIPMLLLGITKFTAKSQSTKQGRE